MSDSTEILSVDECWNLLDRTSVGRLAVDVGGRPDIFPINYVVDDGTLVFRSQAGTKLASAVLLHHVAVEIDGYEPGGRSVWSVVVKGEAHLIEHMQAVYDAQELPLFPWVASPKPNFVRISPNSVTGRRFHVVDDAVTDESIGWRDGVELRRPDTTGVSVDPEPGVEYHPGEPFLRPG